MKRQKTRFSLSCAIPVLLLVGSVWTATAVAEPFVFSHSITTPYWSGHGLVHDGTNLILQGGNKIYTIQPSDGSVLDDYSLSNAHGLGYNGTSLFTVISSWNIAAKLREFDPATGTTIHEISDVYPVSHPTFLNGELYTCGYYNEIQKRNSATGEILDAVPSPYYERSGCIYWTPDALCAYGDNLLAVISINLDNAIVVELDPVTGDRERIFKLGNFTQGVRAIATDGTRLYTTGVVGYDSGAPGAIHVYDPAPDGTPWATAIAAPGRYFASEEDDLELDATWSMASSGIASYEWDVNNDGTYDLFGETPTATLEYLQNTLGMSGRWHTVKLKVTAVDGTIDYDYADLELPEVPEPTTCGILILGGWGILRRGRTGS
ncbi:MAG: hypothetical protein JXA11_11035 [Phycisphaerae bacterium]|nr:hypothetical protein [Phycisphaerae bacterium]